MCSTHFCAVVLAVTAQAFSQHLAIGQQNLPKDPRAVFAMAAPLYDFSDPALKPWHLKATYQLYDDKGNPAEIGTYERWSVSPKVYRSTWTRESATHTDWHTADGKYFYQVTGEPLNLIEYALQSALISPLPEASDLNPANTRFTSETMRPHKDDLTCIMLRAQPQGRAELILPPRGPFPTYCFERKAPRLRMGYGWGASRMEFNQVSEMQGHFIPLDVQFYKGKQALLTATVSVEIGTNPSEAILVPSTQAVGANPGRVSTSAGEAAHGLIKMQAPVYSTAAASCIISFCSAVTLRLVIGVDGRVHNLRMLTAAGMPEYGALMSAVSHWQYRPFLLNGKPIEVETTLTAEVPILGN
jgi:hypothetical protein